MRPIDLDDITIDLTQQFYILCLAPNAARLSVRFFYQNSFGTILKNIEAHYKRMDVVRPSWANDRKFLGIYRMLQETVNMKSKEKNRLRIWRLLYYRRFCRGIGIQQVYIQIP